MYVGTRIALWVFRFVYEIVEFTVVDSCVTFWPALRLLQHMVW